MELEGPDEGDDEFRPPLPPADRLWRHPSELAWQVPPPPPAAGGGRQSWGMALASGLVGAVLAVSIVAAAGGLSTPDGTSPAVVREMVRPPVFPPVVHDVDGSVVRIAAEVRPAITRLDVRSREGRSSGSGVLFRDDGYLLTNSHVVAGARTITVVLATGEEIRGKLVGADDHTDIAVVKIDHDEPLPTAVLGSAAELRVGEPAVAIGSPLGLAGGPSVTTGVVSALGRRVTRQTGGDQPLLDMIQTDAPISPGSSGGALLDGTGAVIGITTAIAVSEVGAEGLGFATPIDIARSVADDIIATGRAVHPWLGVAGAEVDRETAADLGIAGGAVVQDVVPDSPADAAGIDEGDIILSVAGETIESMSELVILLRGHNPGDTVELVWLRDGEEEEGAAQLAERPDDL